MACMLLVPINVSYFNILTMFFFRIIRLMIWNSSIICICLFHIINIIWRVGQVGRKKILRLVGCENVIIHKGHRGRVLLSDVYMTSCCDCQIIEPSCQNDIWRFRVIESSMRLHISSYFMFSRMKFGKCIMQHTT